MKFLLLLVVVLMVLWIMRRGNGVGERRASKPPEAKQPPALEDMVSCAHCGIHLPRSEALPGRGGFYCGEAHRGLHEREMASR